MSVHLRAKFEVSTIILKRQTVYKELDPVSLLNVEYKIIAKVFSTGLKETLPKLISFQKTAYVKNKLISEGYF